WGRRCRCRSATPACCWGPGKASSWPNSTGRGAAQCRCRFLASDVPKRFTLIEAERVLPEIEAIIREAVSLKAEYQEAEQGLAAFAQHVAMQGGVMIDRQALIERRAERDGLASRLKAAIEKIQEYGCFIKDLDIG